MKKEIKVKKVPKVVPMARINTRIRQDQQKYIKSLAKKGRLTEGEVFRAIIDSYKKSNK
jgi:hypothetical protein